MRKAKLLFAPIIALALSSCATGVHHSIEEYFVKSLPYHDGFRILQLTDIHLGDKDYQDAHYAFMDYTIKHANADMIVVTGDLFTLADKETARNMCSFFDSYHLPWTVVFGNHDEQCLFSIDWLTNLLNNYSENCLFKDIQDDDVFGNCNFALNLTEGATVKKQLIFMDSNRYNFNGYFGFDYFKANQIEWYKNLVNYTTSTNGGLIKSLMFYHIPLPEIDNAWEERNNGEPGNEYITGEKKEASCPPKYNSGFFKVIDEMDSTYGMFFGHDHVNDFIVKYHDIYFGYGIKSTDRVYFDDTLLGGRVIVMHDDTTLEFEDIRATYKEVVGNE